MENELSFSTRCRVILIQMIYALATNPENIQSLSEKKLLSVAQNAMDISRYKAKNAKDSAKDLQILTEVVKNLPIIDELILKYCKSDSLERTSQVVLSMLRVGTYEFKYIKHKHSVGNIIKDYLNIAIAFEHEPESSFINGILDKIYLASNQLL